MPSSTSPLTPLLLLASIVLGAVALGQLAREEGAADLGSAGRRPCPGQRPEGRRTRWNWSPSRWRTSSRASTMWSTSNSQTVDRRGGGDGPVRGSEPAPTTPSCGSIPRCGRTFDRLPLGIPEPLIVGRGINDVAILTLTLAPKPEAAARWSDNDLFNIAEELAARAPQGRRGRLYLHRRRPARPDPQSSRILSASRSTASRSTSWSTRSENANRSFRIGRLRQDGDTLIAVAGQDAAGRAGYRPASDPGSRDGRPVYVRDVADVVGRGRSRRTTAPGTSSISGRRTRRADTRPCRRSRSPSPSAPGPTPW